MRCGMLGVHSRFSTLWFHEAFAKACIRSFQNNPLLLESLSVVLVQTCNRSEIYFSAENLSEVHSTLLDILREELDFPFEQQIYSLFGFDCFTHLCSVASGLDSIIVGESDIQRQIKKAYEAASLSYKLSPFTHFLFQKSLKIAKEIRTFYAFPKNRLSLEKMIVHLIQEHGKTNPSILLIGNSDINRKIAHHLKTQGLAPHAIITRSVDEAKTLFKDVEVLEWEKRQIWTEFDIIIAATYNVDYVIDQRGLYPDDLWRKRILFDLSVPRAIDPVLEKIPSIHLFNMESLNKLLAQEKLILEQDLEIVENHLRAAVERQQHVFEKKYQKSESICIA